MSVAKMADGKRWYTSFRYTDWTGKKRQKKKEGFLTKKAAIEFETEFLKKQSSCLDMKFSSLVELYYEDQEVRTRKTTKQTIDSIVRTKILPYFGDLVVNEITALTIRSWQNEMMAAINPRTGKPYSKTYLGSINSKLSAILNYGVRFHGLEKNVCLLLESMGTKKAGKMNFWTVDEFNLAMKYVADWRYRLAFRNLFWTGVRVGELLSFTPVDLLPQKAWNVKRTYYGMENGEEDFGAPKTDNSFREATMPSFLYKENLEYLAALYEISPSDRIFNLSKSALGKVLKAAAKEAGVKRIRVHDLRHSHAALLIELGYSIAVVADRLGDTIQVASSTYAHLYPGKLQEVADELERHEGGLVRDSSSVLKDLETLEKGA